MAQKSSADDLRRANANIRKNIAAYHRKHTQSGGTSNRSSRRKKVS